MAGIFISHASADKPLVDPFVDIIIRLGCEVPKESIFYSSGEDTGIPSGRTLDTYIRSRVATVSLVVAIISPTFQTRPYCIAELGAAWSQVGKLFPIAVPGLPRTDMEGVLSGLAMGYLSHSATLDELHDVVCYLLGINPGARTWGRYKAQWLASIDEHMKNLPTPRVIDPADYDRALSDLEGTRDALRDAQSTIREQEKQIERLAALRSRDEVAEILLPQGERERFDALVKQAKTSLKKLPRPVRNAMWFWFANEPMPWPVSFEDRTDMENSYREGWLRNRPFADDLIPNEEFDEVNTASGAVRRLNRFLEGDLSEAFYNWFRNEHHAPPDLHLKRVWDQLL